MKDAPGLRWVLLLGGVGFAAGFFGPLVFVPEANQGPLVGILISGPLGAVLGLVLYGISSLLSIPARTQWRMLWITASLGAAAVLVGVQPSPARLGTLHVMQVTACSSPADLEADAAAKWEKRIGEVTWAQPRADWRQDLHATLRRATGVVVTLRSMRENVVFENRKPWNRGSLFAIGWEAGSGEKHLYQPEASCDGFPRGLELTLFNSYQLGGRIEPPDVWPPHGLQSQLSTSDLSPVPQRLEVFLAP